MSNRARIHAEKRRPQQKRPPALDASTDDELVRQQAASGVQDSVLDPAALSSAGVLRLQRIIGNQAVQRLIARELAVSAGAPAGEIIQRRGTYEPLSIKAGSVDAIEEQEYGRAATVAFTKITSCIGFLARDGDKVVGVHLGVMDASAKNVKDVDGKALAGALQAFWPSSPPAVYQVGMIDTWDADVLKSIYGVVLNGDEMGADINTAGKIYSATVKEGKLVVSRDSEVIWTEPED